uniref:Uncharacterized protein n=1 Tax=Salix viminalis TaxID=40686 RepID=A0A6N2KJG8_SALVM
MLKGRKVGQPFWQSFLKFLSFEFAYSQCLEGSEHQCWVSFSLFISTIPTSFSVVPGEQVGSFGGVTGSSFNTASVPCNFGSVVASFISTSSVAAALSSFSFSWSEAKRNMKSSSFNTATVPCNFGSVVASFISTTSRFVMDSGNALIFETSRYLKCLSLQIESGKMEQYAKHFFNFGDDK